MRPILPAALLACASFPAYAGGLGIVTTAGLHGDRVYSYQVDAAGEVSQRPVDEQLNPNYGAGLEVILGDKDLKVSGIFRGYYLQDSPQQPPDGQDVIYNIRDVPRDLGIVTAGLQWGLVGDPGNLQLTAVSTIGAAVFTADLTGYVTAELGVGGTWMVARRIQAAASITGGARYQKRFYPTTNAYLGVRYLFD